MSAIGFALILAYGNLDWEFPIWLWAIIILSDIGKGLNK